MIDYEKLSALILNLDPDDMTQEEKISIMKALSRASANLRADAYEQAFKMLTKDFVYPKEVSEYTGLSEKSIRYIFNLEEHVNYSLYKYSSEGDFKVIEYKKERYNCYRKRKYETVYSLVTACDEDGKPLGSPKKVQQTIWRYTYYLKPRIQ